jgi:hypothetical protein
MPTFLGAVDLISAACTDGTLTISKISNSLLSVMY